MIENEKTNVMLTNRDLEVLRSLYDHVVMTFSQIALRHFAGTSKPTVINRLTKLEAAGFLNRERIPRMTLGLDQKACGVVFQITKLGISALKVRHRQRAFKPNPVRVHPFTLHHDLILVDVAAALTRRFGEVEVKNGKLIEANGQGHRGIEPDLVAVLPGGSERLAIELELHDKSEKRYREIVLRYRLAKDFSKVIYLSDDPFVRTLLTRVILSRRTHPGEKPQTGKFYFASLREFLNNPLRAQVTNGLEDLQKGGGR